MLKGKAKLIKSTVSVILSLVMVLSFIGCQGAQPAETTSATTAAAGGETSAQPTSAEPAGEILIGVDTALTGAAPLNGERTRQGINLAVEEINKNGGVLGKNLVVTFEDDQAIPNGAVNAVNKLMSMDIVAQLGPHLSGNVMAVQQIMLKNQKPFLVGGTSPSLITTNNPWLFRIRASDSIVAKIAAKYAVEDLKATKMGIIFDNDAYGTGAKDVATEYLKSINIPLVAEGYNSGDKDLTGQLMKMKNEKVEALIIWAHDAEAAIAAKLAKQLNLNVPIIGNPGFATSSVLDLIGPEDSEGIYTVTDFTPTNPDPRVQEFVTAFQAKYNITPELYAAAYYDAAYVLADAIKRAGSTDADKIRQALMDTKEFKGVMSTLTCSDKGEMVHEAIVAQVKNKAATMIKVVKE